MEINMTEEYPSYEQMIEYNNLSMGTGPFIVVYARTIEMLGAIETILFQYLLRKELNFRERKTLQDDEFFYNILEDVQYGTGLSRRNVETATKNLEEMNLIVTKIKGIPPKKFYKINHKEAYLQFACFRQTNFHGPYKTKCTVRTTTNKALTKLRFNTSCSSTFSESACKKFKPIIKKDRKKEYIKNGIKETLAKNQEKRLQDKKAKLVRTTTFEIDIILDYWRSKGLTVHREGTKSYALLIDRIKSLLKGTLFNSFIDKSNHNRKFSTEEIKRSIDNYCLAAYNSDYEPTNKTFLQELRFVDFFLTDKPCSTEKRKSVFLQFLLERPRQTSQSKIYGAKDEYPHASKIITDWYKKTFGNRDGGKYTLQNRNDIVYATKEIAKFYEKNKSALKIDNWKTMYSQTDPIAFLAVQLTRTMDKILREHDIMFSSFTTSWLKSEKTFNERFPSFLYQESMMKRNQ
jgi:hypothetical protein